MKGIFTILLGTGVLLLGTGLAQNKPQLSNEYQYNAAKQVTVSGTVTEVRDYQCPVTGTVGAHISVKGAEGLIEVHLAPSTYLKKYEIAINKGDQVQIQGSKITFEGKPALIAKQVLDDNVTYAFRNSEGKPLW